jgi:hypothetical protein
MEPSHSARAIIQVTPSAQSESLQSSDPSRLRLGRAGPDRAALCGGDWVGRVRADCVALQKDSVAANDRQDLARRKRRSGGDRQRTPINSCTV